MREPSNLEPLLRADERQLNASRTAYWDAVRRAGVDPAGKVFVDKHPLNTLKLPLIARLFPRAKILFAIRDPRDVVLSCFRRRFNMNSAMYELLTLSGGAAFYDAVMEFADQARPLLGLGWHVVRYESLVSDFEQEMRAVCELLESRGSRRHGRFRRSCSAARTRHSEHGAARARPCQIGPRYLETLRHAAPANPARIDSLGGTPRLSAVSATACGVRGMSAATE